MKLPQGSKNSNFLKTLYAIVNPLEYLEKNAKQYGDIFTSQFSNFPTQVVLSNPQAIQEIFTADANLFESAPGNKILLPILGEYSLILNDGDYHQRQRKLLMPPFHGERMRAYSEIISNITEEVISQWTIGKPFIARASMQEISLRIILRAVFGIEEGERFQQLKQLLGSLFDVFNFPLNSSFIFFKSLQKDLGAWSPWGQFLRKKQQIDQLLFAEIQERKTQGNSNKEDICSLLMSARDEEDQPMTYPELRDELMTLLFAGHETTATALAWALYWIHYIPEVREKLVKELNSLDSYQDFNEISKLPYLNAVCSETLRIYPVVLFTFGRIVKSPIKIMGYEFEPGVMLSPCIYLTHHREDIYPNSKQFKPERFLERQFSPYQFFPFGGGHRRCIGMAFALFEMKLVLVKILCRYQLSLVDNHSIKPVRRGITMTPAGGVKMIVNR